MNKMNGGKAPFTMSIQRVAAIEAARNERPIKTKIRYNVRSTSMRGDC